MSLYFRILSIFMLFLIGNISSVSAAGSPMSFKSFLSDYQLKSPTILNAQQSLYQAEFSKERLTDNWKSKLTLNPTVNHETRVTETVPSQKTPNRNQNLFATFTQQTPTGTTIELNGREVLEKSNPLVNSIDSSYSAKLTQDLIRNSFGKTQRSQKRKAENDYSIAQMEYRQAEIRSCEEAFNLYTDTFIQQERYSVLSSQLRDAQKALKISRQLFNDKLINKIDLLSSENDFLQTKLQKDHLEQQLFNNKRQMTAYSDHGILASLLVSPASFVQNKTVKTNKRTFSEIIVGEKLKSQEFEIDRARADRWTDLQLGLEVGQRNGRLNIGTVTPFTEEYLFASLSLSFDIINRTEDSALNNAIKIKNSLAVQDKIIKQTQKSIIRNLVANEKLLQDQVKTSLEQEKMLNEKANIAFQQMQRGRINFENYLIHRNAYRTQQINSLNLKKDLWLNQFSLRKEFSDENNSFCRGES